MKAVTPARHKVFAYKHMQIDIFHYLSKAPKCVLLNDLSREKKRVKMDKRVFFCLFFLKSGKYFKNICRWEEERDSKADTDRAVRDKPFTKNKK